MTSNTNPEQSQSAHSSHLNLERIVEKFEEQIVTQYPPSSELPYHNCEHHLLTMRRDAFTLVDRCRKYGLNPDILVVRAAAMGHDAMTGTDPALHGASSPERLAALCSARLLRKLGAPAVFCQAVHDAIEDTEADAVARTLEARIIRAADLFSASRRYDEFLDNTRRLHVEYQRIHRKEIPFEQYVARSLAYLGRFMQEDISLTPLYFDTRGRSAWHVAVASNIVKIFKEYVPKGEVLAVSRKEKLPSLSQTKNSRRLVIVPKGYYSEAREMLGADTVVIPVPLKEGVFSIPDGVEDF